MRIAVIARLGPGSGWNRSTWSPERKEKEEIWQGTEDFGRRTTRQSCRDFVDDVVLPFIKQNWKLEWSMVPEDRPPIRILEGAEKIGIRTLGVPEEMAVSSSRRAPRFDLRDGRRGNGARRFRPRRQAGAELEGVGAAAGTRAKHLQEKWFKRLVAEP